MKVYRVRVYDSTIGGVLLSWYGSRREANKAWADFRKARGVPAAGPEGVDGFTIMNTKAAVLRWLNTYVMTAWHGSHIAALEAERNKLHAAVCQAVTLLNACPEVVKTEDGRRARNILREALMAEEDRNG